MVGAAVLVEERYTVVVVHCECQFVGTRKLGSVVGKLWEQGKVWILAGVEVLALVSGSVARVPGEDSMELVLEVQVDNELAEVRGVAVYSLDSARGSCIQSSMWQVVEAGTVVPELG